MLALLIKTSFNRLDLGGRWEYATRTSPIMHLICAPTFCITFVFHFSWVLQPSQEKLKTILMQNVEGVGGGGGIRCIMGVSKWRIHICPLPQCDKVLGRIGCTCNTADINCYVVFSWDQEYISVAKGAAYPRYQRMWQRKHICIEGILEPEAFFFCPFTIKSCKLQQSKLHFGNIEKQTVPFTRCY